LSNISNLLFGSFALTQESQTRGPRATCDPRGYLWRPRCMFFGNFQTMVFKSARPASE